MAEQTPPQPNQPAIGRVVQQTVPAAPPTIHNATVAQPAPGNVPVPPNAEQQQRLPHTLTPPGQAPLYDANGHITHDGARRVIQQGGSVIQSTVRTRAPDGTPTAYDTAHYNNANQLPSAADFAQTADDRAAARERIRQQQAELQRQLDVLSANEKADQAKAKK